MKNWQRVIICVMLIMSVFAMSISVFAENEPEPTPTVPPQLDPNNPVTLQLEMASMYIWKMLDSWGIRVEASDWWNATDDVLAWIKQMMIDFAIDSGVTVGQMIAPWLFNEDIWGNLIANDRAVSDINDFAVWLIAELGLTDNNEIYINPIYTVGGYYLYTTGVMYPAETSDGFESNLYTGIQKNFQGGSAYYFKAKLTDYNKWVSVMLDTDNTAGMIQTYGFDGTMHQLGSNQWWGKGTSNNNGLYYLSYDFPWVGNVQLLPTGKSYFEGTQDELNTFVRNALLQQEGNIAVVTSVIVLPSENPEYNEGDSLTIIDGIPEYEIIDWSGNVTVDNLPAIVSTDSIENPHLEEAYRPIQGLIEYAKDGMSVGTALLYELPDEMVYMWYAVIASLVIWGMIKLMREH